MQCEKDWLVMHTLHTAHGWSIARLAREFGVNWPTLAATPRRGPHLATDPGRARPGSPRRSSPTCAGVWSSARSFGPPRCFGRSASWGTPAPTPRSPAGSEPSTRG
jgi:hypothetical protein